MDRDDFVSEYESIKDRLHSFLWRLTGSRERAGDLLQEAVTRAYEKRSSWRGEAAFSTWIWRIAINAWHDDLRASRRLSPAPGDFPDVAGEEDTEALAVRSEARRRLEEGLATLDDGVRAAFLLRHAEELPYREVAALLGITEENARIRVYRARQAMRAFLGE